MDVEKNAFYFLGKSAGFENELYMLTQAEDLLKTLRPPIGKVHVES